MTKERALIKSKKYLEWAEKAEQKAKSIYHNWCEQYKDFDWTQPILRGHHSQKRHEKIYERRNTIHTKVQELEQKAKRLREKATNLEMFANRNKGDAERARDIRREQASNVFKENSEIYDFAYGSGIVKKVNKKTFTVVFKSGFTCTRDKSYFTR